MKKLNNKGFTLIELLAVVVILLAISVVAVSSISAAIERNKAKQDEAKIDVIISYAKLYYDEHKNSLDSEIATNGYGCIDIYNDLDLSDSERKDSNGDDFSPYIKITKENNTMKYENVNSCS